MNKLSPDEQDCLKNFFPATQLAVADQDSHPGILFSEFVLPWFFTTRC